MKMLHIYCREMLREMWDYIVAIKLKFREGSKMQEKKKCKHVTGSECDFQGEGQRLLADRGTLGMLIAMSSKVLPVFCYPGRVQDAGLLSYRKGMLFTSFCKRFGYSPTPMPTKMCLSGEGTSF